MNCIFCNQSYLFDSKWTYVHCDQCSVTYHLRNDLFAMINMVRIIGHTTYQIKIWPYYKTIEFNIVHYEKIITCLRIDKLFWIFPSNIIEMCNKINKLNVFT